MLWICILWNQSCFNTGQLLNKTSGIWTYPQASREVSFWFSFRSSPSQRSLSSKSPGLRDKALAHTLVPPKLASSKTNTVAVKSARMLFYGHHAWMHQPGKKEFSLFIKTCLVVCKSCCCYPTLYSSLASDERCYLALAHQCPKLGQSSPQLSTPTYFCWTSWTSRSPLLVVGSSGTC